SGLTASSVIRGSRRGNAGTHGKDRLPCHPSTSYLPSSQNTQPPCRTWAPSYRREGPTSRSGAWPGALCHTDPSRYFGVGLSEPHVRGGRYASGRGKGDRSGTTADTPRRVWVFPCDMPPIPFEHRPVWATRSRTRRWAPPSRKEPIDHTSALCDRSSTRGASAHAVRRAQPRLRAERRWVRMQRNSSSP